MQKPYKQLKNSAITFLTTDAGSLDTLKTLKCCFSYISQFI